MKLSWDDVGKRFYELGVSKGVLFVKDDTGAYGNGVAFNGLISVTESPSGAEPNPQYANNKKYLELMSPEEYAFSIEAFTYPDEWEECDGSANLEGVIVGQQPRKKFGFSWVTNIGNDVSENLGYKIHIAYEALAGVSEKAFSTINESPEAVTFSWDATTTPVPFSPATEATEKLKPVSKITIDSRHVDPLVLKSLEDLLYGTETEQATLPSPQEVVELLS